MSADSAAWCTRMRLFTGGSGGQGDRANDFTIWSALGDALWICLVESWVESELLGESDRMALNGGPLIWKLHAD